MTLAQGADVVGSRWSSRSLLRNSLLMFRDLVTTSRCLQNVHVTVPILSRYESLKQKGHSTRNPTGFPDALSLKAFPHDGHRTRDFVEASSSKQHGHSNSLVLWEMRRWAASRRTALPQSAQTLPVSRKHAKLPVPTAVATLEDGFVNPLSPPVVLEDSPGSDRGSGFPRTTALPGCLLFMWSAIPILAFPQ